MATSDVAQLADSSTYGNNSRQGVITVATSKNQFKKNTNDLKLGMTDVQLETDLTNEFDDIRYYSGDDSA